MKIIKVILFLIMILTVICGSYWLYFNIPIGYRSVNRIEQLMLTERDLPNGWALKYEMPITGDFDWGVENKLRGFELKDENGHLMQYVYKFYNIHTSKNAYSHLKQDLMLFTKENKTAFVYESQVADEWLFVRVQLDSGGEGCAALGRYKNYIIYLRVIAQQKEMTDKDLQKILRTIDDRMKTFLRLDL